MDIIYIHKDKFQKRPPVINTVMILSDLGHKITVIDEEISDYWKDIFQKKDIDYFEIKREDNPSKLGKIINYLAFRYKTYKIINKGHKKKHQITLWIEGAQTILALGKKINNYRHILQIQELHENSRIQLNAIRKVINTADYVFMPEYVRSLIYKIWFNLKKDPILLPNKPYILPSINECNIILKQYENILKEIKGKKIILYQGGISYERKIDVIAQAINKLGPNYHLLLVGKEGSSGYVGNLRNITKQLTHIDYIPSPNYLAFCSIAFLGVVFYDINSLNNIFCAPNKIFEYSAYKIPMIGNNIPGLRETIEANGAGLCIDLNNTEEIVKSIHLIENNYEKFKEKAYLFYNSVDNKKTIFNCIGGNP